MTTLEVRVLVEPDVLLLVVIAAMVLLILWQRAEIKRAVRAGELMTILLAGAVVEKVRQDRLRFLVRPTLAEDREIAAAQGLVDSCTRDRPARPPQAPTE